MARVKVVEVLICEHDARHEQYDPSLWRVCRGEVANLKECVKCYTLGAISDD